MVCSDRVRYILEQYGLTGLGLSHYQGTLSLTYGSEHINHAGRQVVIMAVAQGELFIREQRGKVFKRYAITCHRGLQTVYAEHLNEREIFLTLTWRTDNALHNISGLKSEQLDL